MARRSRILAAVALGAALAAAAFATQIPSAHAESNGGVRVMPLGDSITDGIMVPGGYRIGLWQRITSAGYRVDFVGSLSNGPASLGDHDHEGHSGWRIDQIDASINGWLQTYQPRTILLHIGTNDIIQNVSGAPARLGTLLDHITAAAPNADVFVATIIPLSSANSAVQTFNAAVPGIVSSRVSAGKHLHLVDMYSKLTTADLADGVHPNAGGYDKMAAAWWSALMSVPGSLGPGPSASPSTSVGPSASPSRSAGPSTSPSRSVGPSASPSGSRGCSATYTVVNQWQGGFQGGVTVTAGSAGITGWTVTWTFASGQAINQSWNATVTASGSSVTARNVSYNGSLGAGASTSFGFTGTWNGSNPAPTVSCSAA